MKPFISIIIPEYKDSRYLVRCLNSIARQRYQNIEILLVQEDSSHEICKKYNVKPIGEGEQWERLRYAVQKAEGQYVLFQRVTSVIAPNTLEAFVNNLNDDENCYYIANYLGEKDGSFFPVSGIEFGFYGHLFEKKKLLRAMEKENDLDRLLSVSFMVEYRKQFQKVEINEDACIYESDPENVSSDNCRAVDLEQVEALSESISAMAAERIENKRVYDILLGNAKDTLNEIKIIGGIARNFSDDLEWNYSLARKYLVSAYKECFNVHSEELFEAIKQYLLLWKEQKKFQELLLNEITIGREEKELFFGHSLEEYVFFKNHGIHDSAKTEESGKNQGHGKEIKDQLSWEKGCGKMQESMDELMKQICEMNANLLQMKQRQNDTDTVRSEFNKLESLLVSAADKKEVKASVEDINGPVLAEFVVQKYAQGNLGLRTILKSMIAWFKYKF